MEKRPGRGPTLRSGAHRYGVGPIVTVDGLSVRARTDSPALGDVGPACGLAPRPRPFLPCAWNLTTTPWCGSVRVPTLHTHGLKVRPSSSFRVRGTRLRGKHSDAQKNKQKKTVYFSKRTNRRKPFFFPRSTLTALHVTLWMYCCAFMTVWDVYGCFVVVFTCVCCDDDGCPDIICSNLANSSEPPLNKLGCAY